MITEYPKEYIAILIELKTGKHVVGYYAGGNFHQSSDESGKFITSHIVYDIKSWRYII